MIRVWAQPLGGPEQGFPLLSGAGRMVLKEAIRIGAALVTMANSAKACLQRWAGDVQTERPRELAEVLQESRK